MTTKTLPKFVALYHRGFVNSGELQNALLYALCVNDVDLDETGLRTILGDDLYARFMNYLQDIQNTDYRWKHYLIGGKDETDYSMRIRELCDQLLPGANVD
ncbi:MAG: hypothetical protein QM811_05955 [Pirellulales bacterium]